MSWPDKVKFTPQTHCRNGHEYVEGSFKIRVPRQGNPHRECIPCRKERQLYEHNKARHQRWYKNNPDKARLQRERWKANSPEGYKKSTRASAKKWSQKNPEKVRVYSSRHRARKENAPINDLTEAQWEEVKRRCKYKCVECDSKNISMDHVVPLSKGGNHTVQNITVLCRSCNSRKGAGEVLSPVQLNLLV